MGLEVRGVGSWQDEGIQKCLELQTGGITDMQVELARHTRAARPTFISDGI